LIKLNYVLLHEKIKKKKVKWIYAEMLYTWTKYQLAKCIDYISTRHLIRQMIISRTILPNVGKLCMLVLIGSLLIKHLFLLFSNLHNFFLYTSVQQEHHLITQTNMLQ